MAVVHPITFSGSFDKTDAPTTITSDTRTATVPVANTGGVRCASFSMTGTVALASQINGGSFNAVSDGDVLAIVNGDTLAFRITGAASGEALAFALTDVRTGRLIETVNLVSS